MKETKFQHYHSEQNFLDSISIYGSDYNPSDWHISSFQNPNHSISLDFIRKFIDKFEEAIIDDVEHQYTDGSISKFLQWICEHQTIFKKQEFANEIIIIDLPTRLEPYYTMQDVLSAPSIELSSFPLNFESSNESIELFHPVPLDIFRQQINNDKIREKEESEKFLGDQSDQILTELVLCTFKKLSKANIRIMENFVQRGVINRILNSFTAYHENSMFQALKFFKHVFKSSLHFGQDEFILAIIRALLLIFPNFTPNPNDSDIPTQLQYVTSSTLFDFLNQPLQYPQKTQIDFHLQSSTDQNNSCSESKSKVGCVISDETQEFSEFIIETAGKVLQCISAYPIPIVSEPIAAELCACHCEGILRICNRIYNIEADSCIPYALISYKNLLQQQYIQSYPNIASVIIIQARVHIESGIQSSNPNFQHTAILALSQIYISCRKFQKTIQEELHRTSEIAISYLQKNVNSRKEEFPQVVTSILKLINSIAEAGFSHWLLGLGIHHVFHEIEPHLRANSKILMARAIATMILLKYDVGNDDHDKAEEIAFGETGGYLVLAEMINVQPEFAVNWMKALLYISIVRPSLGSELRENGLDDDIMEFEPSDNEQEELFLELKKKFTL